MWDIIQKIVVAIVLIAALAMAAHAIIGVAELSRESVETCGTPTCTETA